MWNSLKSYIFFVLDHFVFLRFSAYIGLDMEFWDDPLVGFFFFFFLFFIFTIIIIIFQMLISIRR
jgi:hypothetical protein